MKVWLRPHEQLATPQGWQALGAARGLQYNRARRRINQAPGSVRRYSPVPVHFQQN